MDKDKQSPGMVLRQVFMDFAWETCDYVSDADEDSNLITIDGDFDLDEVARVFMERMDVFNK